MCHLDVCTEDSKNRFEMFLKIKRGMCKIFGGQGSSRGLYLEGSVKFKFRRSGEDKKVAIALPPLELVKLKKTWVSILNLSFSKNCPTPPDHYMPLVSSVFAPFAPYLCYNLKLDHLPVANYNTEEETEQFCQEVARIVKCTSISKSSFYSTFFTMF